MLVMDQIRYDLDANIDLPILIEIRSQNAATIRKKDGDMSKLIDLIRVDTQIIMAIIDINGDNNYALFDITLIPYAVFIGIMVERISEFFADHPLAELVH